MTAGQAELKTALEPRITLTDDEITPPIGSYSHPNGQTDSTLEMVRNLNEVFDTGEKGEVSFVRAMLRCLGHSAIGTNLDNWPVDEEIPPVSPWKLMATLAKSAVSKEHRRTMMKRIGEEMSIGDSLGLLGVLYAYGEGKRLGLSKEDSQNRAWNFYAKLGQTQPRS